MTYISIILTWGDFLKNVSLYENVPPLKNNFQVRFLGSLKQTRLTPHWHEHIELLYFIDGVCTFTCNGKTFTAQKGDFVVINSAEVHSFISKGKIKYFCMLIYPEFFSDVNFKNILIKNHIPYDMFIEKAMFNINSEHSSDKDGSDMMVKSYVYSVMTHLVRNYTYAHITEKDIYTHSSNLKRLDTVFEYISNNYDKELSTHMLSNLCYVSESYFCRFFKKATGKTVANYINEYRIEKAAYLIKNTDSTISEISLRTGFGDANYFSRVFKKVIGKSPSEYRQ